jgi:hypothetical protein
MRQEGGHVVETPVEARAGHLDRPVFKVLVASTLLVAVIFAVVYFAYFAYFAS